MQTLSGSILVVDDDAAVGTVLSALARQAGLSVSLVRSAEGAVTELEKRPVDVVLTDLRMPGRDGMWLLSELTQRWPEIPVVMISAHGTVSAAVEAMRAGAADFVQKPIDRDELLFVLHKALTSATASAERAPSPSPAPAAPAAQSFGEFVGTSRHMREVYELLQRAAPSNATVLLRGESGTGKELAARALHASSPRRDRPFVRIHCGALPDALLESELFGYEKGAFTGAVARKPGRIELADGGTAFLDEIGDITPAMQVKLLRVLQDKSFERLGGNETVKVDVRFVAATHRPLEELVATGEFREDLFYRLNVVPVWLPPLRARPEDIPVLVQHFLKDRGASNGRPDMRLQDDALALLSAEPWKGNVRQLENFVERLVVLSPSSEITADDVRRELQRAAPAFVQAPSATEATSSAASSSSSSLDERRKQTERDAMLEALEQAKGNRTLAAKLLGVSRRTLYNKLEEHGLG